MGTIEDVSSFLQNLGLGSEGSTLFCNYWGSNAQNNAILLTEVKTGPPERYLGSSDTLKESGLCILVRNTDIVNAKANALSVYNALDGATISGYVSCYCEQGEPVQLNKEWTESGDIFYYSVNVSLKYI